MGVCEVYNSNGKTLVKLEIINISECLTEVSATQRWRVGERKTLVELKGFGFLSLSFYF